MHSIGATMKIFKQCTCCDLPWSSRTDFLQDANTELVGYQANFCQLELGYFLFNHLTCESTIAIQAGLFQDMYAGPLFAQRLTGTEVCQGFCEDMDAIEPCDAQCECAYVREIMQIIRKWPKKVPQLANITQVDDYEVPYLSEIESRKY